MLASLSDVPAAEFPAHDGLRILIVSDEVNPHGLPPSQLTQPGELAAALIDPSSGVHLDPRPDAVVEIATNDLEQATALLAIPRGDPNAYDVLVYFAHRIPNEGQDDVGRQAAFTAAVEQFLVDGGGVVSFHHGSYLTAGKEMILDLIGAAASGGVTWSTVTGQNVINVAPAHFVGCHAVTYPSSVSYADPARGVEAGTYPFFNNTPDERYPTFEIDPQADEVEVLFGSNYVQNGATHLLGFTHRRPAWRGVVVAYQPGEYQPHALDDPEGANFQILANALVYASGKVPADGVLLALARGTRGSVTLSWTACAPTHAIHRSDVAADVGDASNLVTVTTGDEFTDAPTGDLVFYLVLATP